MEKYLWDFVIEDIPCGWEETYQEALRNCPDGEIIMMECSLEEYDERVFYHPVKCRELLINRFNELKSKAMHLVKNKNTLSVNEFVFEIFKVDAELFSLLTTWSYSDDQFEGGSFNPQRFLNGWDYSFYIMDDFHDNDYANLRIINPNKTSE